jgi:hypothetical protein
MQLNLIIDYETIGPYVFTCAVVNCAYYTFDWDRFASNNPYTFEEIISDAQFDKFDIKHQLKRGYTALEDDVAWWTKQGPIAKKQIKPSEDDITTEQFCENFTDYIKSNNRKVKRWWSRSNTFDPLLLQRNFFDVYGDNLAVNQVLDFWKVRDIRTFIDTRFDFKNIVNGICPISDETKWKEMFQLHNPVHDIAADVLRMQRIERIISDKEI